jgi:hypothetical protein
MCSSTWAAMTKSYARSATPASGDQFDVELGIPAPELVEIVAVHVLHRHVLVTRHRPMKRADLETAALQPAAEVHAPVAVVGDDAVVDDTGLRHLRGEAPQRLLHVGIAHVMREKDPARLEDLVVVPRKQRVPRDAQVAPEGTEAQMAPENLHVKLEV